MFVQHFWKIFLQLSLEPEDEQNSIMNTKAFEDEFQNYEEELLIFLTKQQC